ncbi:MAG: hypothetical protein R3Y13_00625 [bacterium]
MQGNSKNIKRLNRKKMGLEYIKGDYLYIEDFCEEHNITKKSFEGMLRFLKTEEPQITEQIRILSEEKVLERYDDTKQQFDLLIRILEENKEKMSEEELIVLIYKYLPIKYITIYNGDIDKLKVHGINLTRKTEFRKKIEELLLKMEIENTEILVSYLGEIKYATNATYESCFNKNETAYETKVKYHIDFEYNSVLITKEVIAKIAKILERNKMQLYSVVMNICIRLYVEGKLDEFEEKLNIINQELENTLYTKKK